MPQKKFGPHQAPGVWLSDTPIFAFFTFFIFPQPSPSWATQPPYISQYFESYEQKTVFFAYFSVLEGSQAVQLVSKQVGNGLETCLLTFGAHKHPLCINTGPFLGHFGPKLVPFLAHFGPKWTKNRGSGAQKGVPEGPKWHQNGPKMTGNDVKTL